MDDKKLENVKPAKNHNSTNFICGGKAIKATSDYELDKKPRILPQFATQLVALPFCLADPFLAAKISIMDMFEVKI